jgi:hypothetical protein
MEKEFCMCHHQGRHDHHHHEHHDHHHEHEHDHHHQGQAHSHGPGGGEAPAAAITPTEKLTRMVEHWLHHNEEHARSFIDWADRARSMGQAAVAVLIDDVARQSLLQNEQLRKALQLLKSASGQTA